jgi:transposase, mutator family
MSHRHFTISERNKLEVLLKENYKIARIAEILEKDRTTIYREIKRVKGEYCAEKAQINANNKGCKNGIDVSPSMISKITDKIIPEIREWQSRQLEDVYPIVFMDAIHYSVRKDGVVVKKAVYLAIGIDKEGRKEVLGFFG